MYSITSAQIPCVFTFSFTFSCWIMCTTHLTDCVGPTSYTDQADWWSRVPIPKKPWLIIPRLIPVEPIVKPLRLLPIEPFVDPILLISIELIVNHIKPYQSNRMLITYIIPIETTVDHIKSYIEFLRWCNWQPWWENLPIFGLWNSHNSLYLNK